MDTEEGMLQRGILNSLICLLSATGLLLATTAAAQKVELTPFVGFHFGGDFDEEADIFPSSTSEFDLDDTESVGAILGIGITRGLQLELIWSSQETELIEDLGFFGAGQERSDLDLSYYHVGVAYQWNIGQVRPFVAGSLGVTEIDPARMDLDNDTRLSVGVGGGVKLMFSKNIGLRFEGRVLATDISDNDRYCDDHDCYCDEYDCDNDDLIQGVLRGGLVIAF